MESREFKWPLDGLRVLASTMCSFLLRQLVTDEGGGLSTSAMLRRKERLRKHKNPHGRGCNHQVQ